MNDHNASMVVKASNTVASISALVIAFIPLVLIVGKQDRSPYLAFTRASVGNVKRRIYNERQRNAGNHWPRWLVTQSH
jgi:hypothetical protein